MTVKVCVYNYKGGASKTTITINLSAAFAKQGKKVLIVDLDPQCNATQFWNTDYDDAMSDTGSQSADAAGALVAMAGGGETRVGSDELHPTKFNSDMSAFVSDMLKTPLYKMLNAHFTLTKQDKLDELLNDATSISECNPDFFEGKLWLLKGSQLIFKFERDITAALEDQSLADKNVKPIGIINYILNKLADKHNFDVIILDVSPSNSSLNQISALSCDYILPPCNASLYSCGSIYGLFETVLPGKEGWLGAQKRFADKQWEPNWEQSEEGQELIPFRLPKKPPTLLPILVTNYGMEAPTSAELLSRKRRAPGSDLNARTVRFQPSQFVYTLESYLKNCTTIKREAGTSAPGPPSPSRRTSTIELRANCGREAIAFCPSVPVSIAATEALGRPFVEITLEQFSDFYGFDKDEMKTSQKALKERSALLKKLMEYNLLDSLADNANDVFTREVSLVRERYESLAAWLANDVFHVEEMD